MSLQVWAAYLAAVFILVFIPGPTVLFVITQSVLNGKKALLPLVTGVFLGDITAMSLSVLGLGTVLAASAVLFHIIKWIGAFYLIYLGLSILFSRKKTENELVIKEKFSGIKTLKQAYFITSLNPKGIIFFVAFFPQFINHHGDYFNQILIMGISFLFIATINTLFYSFFAGTVGEHIKKPEVKKIFDFTGAGALIGAGIFTAAARR